MTRSRPAVTVRALRFAVTGVLMTGLHVAVAAALLTVLSLGAAVSNGIAFAVATVVSFAVNTAWSFSSRMGAATLLRFLAVSLIGCGVSMTVAGAAEAAGFAPWAGIAFVVLVVPPLTFVLHNVWTYR